MNTEHALPLELKAADDYQRLLDLIAMASRGSLLFRGQSDASWFLEPSLYRVIKGMNLTVREALDLEMTGVRLFQDAAKSYLHVQPESILDWWALMQHYGAPTRLLDWTENVKVALYFAACDHSNLDGRIWIINRLDEECSHNCRHGCSVLPDDPRELADLLKALEPPLVSHLVRGSSSLTDRLKSQSAAFSVCRALLARHDVGLMSDKRQLSSLVLRARFKAELMHRLYLEFVTADFLFPGLDGVGRSIKAYYTEFDWLRSRQRVFSE